MPAGAPAPPCHPTAAVSCPTQQGFPLAFKPVPGAEVFTIVIVCVLLLFVQHFALKHRSTKSDD